MTVDPSHERWHAAPSGRESSVWREGHRLHMKADDEAGAAVEVIIQIERLGDASRVEFRTAVVAQGDPLVGIIETRIPTPSRGWEIRTSGLWADHICEDPLVHWSYGLEAFAIAVDAPADLTESGYGDRVPLGWELEFEAESNEPATWQTPNAHYSQPGRAHGLLLDADGEHETSGVATRHHWWGDDPRTGPQPFDLTVAAAWEASR